jgi:methylmalonyl-CoA/ethylmalonyl-CoA epimerase
VKRPFKILRLHHVGMVSRDVSATKSFLTKVLGLEFVGEEAVPSEKTLTYCVSCPNAMQLELLEPLEGEGPIQKYRERFKGGVHHLAFEVDDLDAAVQYLKHHRVPMLGDGPSLGQGGCRVLFIHPKGTGGFLLELVESPQPPYCSI